MKYALYFQNAHLAPAGLQHDMAKRSAVILSASRRGALGAKKHVLLAEVGGSAAVPAAGDVLMFGCCQDVANW